MNIAWLSDCIYPISLCPDGEKEVNRFRTWKNETCQTNNLHTGSRMWWDIHCTVKIASTFTNYNCNEWCFLVWRPGRLISDSNKTFQLHKMSTGSNLGTRLTHSYWSTVSSTVAFIYLYKIFTVHISSFFDEGFHCVHIATVSCPV